MVQPLNQTSGYTQVGDKEPLALSKTEASDTIVQSPSPSILKTEPVAPPQTSEDFSQASQVEQQPSQQAPDAASTVTPNTPQVDWTSNLGNILSNILGGTQEDKQGTEAQTTGTNTSPSQTSQKETPVVKSQDSTVPGLEGYKSVLPDTKSGGGPVAQNDRAAIRQIESGSKAGNYRAVGKKTRTGDRAYGAYQVMGANIPSWTKKYVGRAMSVTEFMNDPAAQDKVFDGEFGRLKSKYGGPGAAQAWFAGEAGMKRKSATDVNGTSVSQYGRMFSSFGGTA